MAMQLRPLLGHLRHGGPVPGLLQTMAGYLVPDLPLPVGARGLVPQGSRPTAFCDTPQLEQPSRAAGYGTPIHLIFMDRQLIGNIAGVIFSATIVAIGFWLEHAKKKRAASEQRVIRQQHIQAYRPITFDSRLPTLSKDGFELVDIADLARSIDYINPLPTMAEKSRLSPGDLVKLQFIDGEDDVERMWVEVVARQDDLFRGILCNDSILSDRPQSGGDVWFHANHIFEIHG
jgi:hypothetical protein